MPYRHKTEHLPYLPDGVESYNQLSPELMKNLLHDLSGIAYRCKNDSKWTMLFISEGCLELSGYKPEALLYNSEMSFDELILPEDRELVRLAVDEGVKNNCLYQMEYRIRHIDGSIRWVWEKGRAVYSEKGEAVYLDGFITDVTYRHELKEMLRQRAFELNELNLMKDRFFTSIVSNLQDPVYSFIMLNEFIRQNLEKFSANEILTFLNQMNQSALSMNLLLENLMGWSQAATGKLKYQACRFGLKEAIDESLTGVADSIRQRGMTVEIEVPERCQLQTDRQLFLTMFKNLVSNGVKYSKTKGRLRILGKQDREGLQLVVWDEGVGIPRRELPYLFQIDREYRQPGTLDETGTGFGLLLVKEIMKLLKGDVEVQSRVNQGTKVILKLPAELLAEQD